MKKTCRCIAALLLSTAPLSLGADFHPANEVELVAAINMANANNEPDTIDLSAVFIFSLAAPDNGINGLPVIRTDGDNPLTLRDGWIYRDHDVAEDFRIFEIEAGATLNLDDVSVSDGIVDPGIGGSILNRGALTIKDAAVRGFASEAGGGIYNASGGALHIENSSLGGNSFFELSGSGGAIYNDVDGVVTITGSRIFRGVSAGRGGGIFNAGTLIANGTHFDDCRSIRGGALFNTGTVDINESLFSQNRARNGGAIYQEAGHLSITNGTISNNGISLSSGAGGGLYNDGGSFEIYNSTIAFNRSGPVGVGGGIFTRAGVGQTTVLVSTLIAGNSTGLIGGESDLIVDITSGNLPIGAADHNLIETAEGANGVVHGIDGNIVGQGDPGLVRLTDECGPLGVVAVRAGSAAIDAGSNPLGLTVDQRGYSRTVGVRTDIGAYEYAAPITLPATVAQLIQEICQINNNDVPDTIDLGGNTFTMTAPTGFGAAGIFVESDGGNALTIRNGTIERAANVTQFRLLSLKMGSVLNLDRVTIRGGRSNAAGGGIRIEPGSVLNLSNSTVSGNATGDVGGGIYIDGTGHLNATNSTISGNEAHNNTLGGGGGGIHNKFGYLNISHSTIVNNTSARDGAGIRTLTHGPGTPGLIPTTTLLTNTLIANNTATDPAATEHDLSVDTDTSNPAIDTAINNLIGDAAGASGVTDGVDGNIVGRGDPGLGGLADNGGPTQTHALHAGSDAIDAADIEACTSATVNGLDQRGAQRHFDGDGTPDAPAAGDCDIGAFEYRGSGTINIVLDAVPDGAQDIAFEVTGGLDPASFSLDEDADPTLSSSQTFTDVVPGDYVVTQADPAPAYDLASLTCSDADDGTTVSLGARAATVDLDADETVTCVFTNTAEADLTIAMSDSVDPVVAGNPLTYAITVQNRGPNDARDVQVTLSLPSGISFSSSTGCLEDPNGMPTCSLGTITQGGSAQYTIATTVAAGTAGTISNGATVVSSTPLINNGDDAIAESTGVTAPAPTNRTGGGGAGGPLTLLALLLARRRLGYSP